MSLTLEKLAKTTNKSPEELDNLGIPLTCEKGHSDIRYTPTNTEVMIECQDCGFNDVCMLGEKIQLYS